MNVSSPRTPLPSEASYEAAGVLRLTGGLLRRMVATLGWRLAAAVALSVALALTEGAAVVLLVPLLAAVGLIVTDGPVGHLAGWATAAFGAAGLAPTLPFVLGAFLALTVAQAVLSRWHMVLAPSTEQRFTLALRDRLYAAIVSARWSFLVQRRATDLAHALTTDMERLSTAAFQLLRLMATLCATAIYVALAARLSFTLTALAAAGSIAMLWLHRGRTRHATERGAVHAESDRRLNAMVHESLAALKVAKSAGAEARDVAAHRDLAAAASRDYLAVIGSLAGSKQRTDIAAGAALALLLYVGVAGFGIRGASLLLLMFVFSRIVPRMLTLQQSIQLFAVGLPAYARIEALSARCEAEAERVLETEGPAVALHDRLALEAVSFSYERGGRPALRDVSLEIRAGQTIAVVGPSGGGKSTLADIVIGLLQPQAGQVRVDDAVLTPDRFGAWRRAVGYVPQDTFLLHASVRANLAWAAPDATDAGMWEALELAAAADFVSAMPGGLEAIVGDRGACLSGGERQRISLARALLRKPALLILDEATSALDAESERLILDALSRLKGRLTVLMITHRLAAVSGADVIHVLDGGAVVESGSWEQLTTAPGLFRRLLEAQAGRIPPAMMAHPQLA